MKGERIWAEIDLRQIKKNLQVLKRLTGVKNILLAVKADAYGHGAKEIAAYLDGEVAGFGVASVEEGIALRQNGTKKSNILVLSPVPYELVPQLFEYRLMPTITEKEILNLLIKEAKRLNKRIAVHLEVDTGMGRTGLSRKEMAEILPLLRENNFIKLAGIFSHFPAADSDFAFTNYQIQTFRQFIKKTLPNKNAGVLCHLANSAGVVNFPDSYLDMIRPGLIVYGIVPENWWNSPLFRKMGRVEVIRPVLSLYSRVLNLRRFPRGISISYERRFFTTRDSLIAVIAAGYGDGVPYHLTNRGKVLIRGKEARIVGQVCMDLLMADVSDCPEVKIGDKVTLIGKDGKEEIKVTDLAFWANTIPYEITCRISPRVARVFKEGEKILKIRK